MFCEMFYQGQSPTSIFHSLYKVCALCMILQVVCKINERRFFTYVYFNEKGKLQFHVYCETGFGGCTIISNWKFR